VTSRPSRQQSTQLWPPCIAPSLSLTKKKIGFPGCCGRCRHPYIAASQPADLMCGTTLLNDFAQLQCTYQNPSPIICELKHMREA
jgi:hypothetical protein